MSVTAAPPVKKITTPLYGGSVQLDFDIEKHEYRVEGRVVPGVSSIAGMIDKSSALMNWAGKQVVAFLKEHAPPHGVDIDRKMFMSLLAESKGCWRRKTEEAAATGTLVHAAVENYIKNRVEPPNDLPEPVLKGYSAFKQWIAENEVEFVHSEKPVYSKKYGFAGTTDLIAKIRKRLSIVDFKTSKAIYPFEQGVQLAGYQIALEEELGEQFDGRWIVRLDKKSGALETLEVGHEKEDRLAFLGALMIYRRHALEPRKPWFNR